MLPAAGLASAYIVKNWPERVEPGNPMAKYRNDVSVED
jgi:hypothetical protein